MSGSTAGVLDLIEATEEGWRWQRRLLIAGNRGRVQRDNLYEHKPDWSWYAHRVAWRYDGSAVSQQERAGGQEPHAY
ncbi:MAG: hypothetical protein M1118_09800 [Chloroflexi bacterium]|nr:hypothetical protein [Chloroflexota bacterium]